MVNLGGVPHVLLATSLPSGTNSLFMSQCLLEITVHGVESIPIPSGIYFKYLLIYYFENGFHYRERKWSLIMTP